MQTASSTVWSLVKPDTLVFKLKCLEDPSDAWAGGNAGGDLTLQCHMGTHGGRAPSGAQGPFRCLTVPGASHSPLPAPSEIPGEKMEPLCSSHLHILLLEPGLRLVESETIRETSCHGNPAC